MTLPWRFGLGLLLSGLIAYAGWRQRALSSSGAGGAVLVGTVIFALGGWTWGLLLITFFVLSSGLSFYKKQAKRTLSEKFEKGARRDLGQVLANGGAGALLAVIYGITPDATLLAAFVGAMASVNADTWATELGVLSRKPPRLLTTGHRVEPGTSGGISALGMLATLAGGSSIGTAAVLFTAWFDGASPPARLWLLPIAALSGLTGSLCDSLLGATIQAIYYSQRREKETERKIDPDGQANPRIRGWRWLNNDWVNFLSSLVGAASAAALWHLLAG